MEKINFDKLNFSPIKFPKEKSLYPLTDRYNKDKYIKLKGDLLNNDYKIKRIEIHKNKNKIKNKTLINYFNLSNSFNQTYLKRNLPLCMNSYRSNRSYLKIKYPIGLINVRKSLINTFLNNSNINFFKQEQFKHKNYKILAEKYGLKVKNVQYDFIERDFSRPVFENIIINKRLTGIKKFKYF